MAVTDRVQALAEPLCAAEGVELVDVELAGGVLRITIDRPGGLDLDVIARLTRQISRLLDETDPVPGRYTLEVSSPGLERRLRTAAHFQRAIGDLVTMRTVAGTEAGRRVRGTIVAADDTTVTVAVGEAPAAGDDDRPVHVIRLEQIERARTVFEWGPTPKPGSPKASAAKAGAPKSKQTPAPQKAAKP